MRQWITAQRGRWKDLLEEFGSVALGTYLVMAVAVFVTFVVMIRTGFEVEGAAASAGTFGAAWVGLKLTQPFRIAATVLMTPPVAIALRRRKSSTDDP